MDEGVVSALGDERGEREGLGGGHERADVPAGRILSAPQKDGPNFVGGGGARYGASLLHKALPVRTLGGALRCASPARIEGVRPRGVEDGATSRRTVVADRRAPVADRGHRRPCPRVEQRRAANCATSASPHTSTLENHAHRAHLPLPAASARPTRSAARTASARRWTRWTSSEKGITIQSAATHCQWGDHEINIIDTPGHVDFTIEVERALRVLDGAILVLCGVAGVQSQSITVDRQMKRYKVPRLAFINKLDREGSNPDTVIAALREKLMLNAAAVQLPIGLEAAHAGVVDVITMEARYFEGKNGEEQVIREVPPELVDDANAVRQTMLERLADVDDEIADLFLEEADIDAATLKAAVRRCTIAQTFVPVFMGSAFKNKGVHPLLDGVKDYLPAPTEVENVALDLSKNEEPVVLSGMNGDPVRAACLAFFFFVSLSRSSLFSFSD